ncbi:MAG: EscV/YscV/HrcV family type III secretion system export apparatus protein [Deltaproteobacteria bacterium CG_4_9_14_3_um_filter_63_12]|nr:MAG: EscV/YscV/HrcV family type III secretion system export apparatus protein [Deltaproteobacteria bacterium CG17_big_fil_post_rev_8_21_14_2_50_63_7]PJB36731.1 MAG: EscV/YscV/HrcV family type III secretion system export apparatus protein [Deltaproteobacteria bacterium CG_4_9_14_3_um_filter_63_12]
MSESSRFVSSLSRPASTLGARVPEFVLVGMILCVVAILVLPLSAWMLDLLLASNLCLAVVILLVALAVERPLSISTFPAMLLITTLTRLGLNVSSTRLILRDGYAGDVISAFSSWVVGGSLIVGVVIFLILTVVQFVVIAKGGERVAEVAARFTLDAMPGRQMAIDADQRAGSSSREQTHRAREQLQQESRFYGAMDGAMKFVKGDAIAGLFILGVDLLGGIAVGILERGTSPLEALEIYGRLTIGDGLITQIPALLLATSAAFVVTRVASSTEDGTATPLAQELFGQLGEQPRVFAAAAMFMAGLALLPGLPGIPFILLALLLTGLSMRKSKRGAVERSATSAEEVLPAKLAVYLPPSAGAETRAALVVQVDALFRSRGLEPPDLQLAEADGEGFTVELDGLLVERTSSSTEELLALIEDLLPHVLTMREVTQLLTRWRDREPALIDAAVPRHLSLYEFTMALRRLVADGLSIQALDTLLEVVLSLPQGSDEERLHQEMRVALGYQVGRRLISEERTLLLLAEDVRRVLEGALVSEGTSRLNLSAAIQNEIIDAILVDVRALDASARVAVVTSKNTRAAVERMLASRVADVLVVAIEEMSRAEALGLRVPIRKTTSMIRT